MSWLKKDKVVVPTDFSAFSLSAINIARNFVDDNNNIHVIHVIREINPRLLDSGLGKEYVDKRPDFTEKELKSNIATEFPGINIHVEEGEPGGVSRT